MPLYGITDHALKGGCCLAILGLLAGCPLLTPPPPDMILGVEVVADGLSSPVGLAVPPDASGRLFVVDQIGVIRIIGPAGLLAEPFLDVRDRMVAINPFFDERGLLSMAFHPDYAENARFFVVYNAPLRDDDPAGFNCRWRLSEFTVSGDDPDLADSASETILLEVLKPQATHNGGQLAFDAEGRLYVSLGDGGGANDTGFGHTPGLGNGQDRSNLLGTILRYELGDVGELTPAADNPFVGEGGDAAAVYAFGLRNPWRFSFDVGRPERLFCADVGQALFEEVNLITAGGNYGWNIREGRRCFDPDSPTEPPDECPTTGAEGEPLIDPIIVYRHVDEAANLIGVAVIGGYVYRGAALPDLDGAYIFGDWSTSFPEPDGSLFLATEQLDGSWEMAFVGIAGAAGERLGRYLLGFGQDAAGEVYLLTSMMSGPSGVTGEVLRVVPP